MSSLGQASWLQIVAAAGTLVSLGTFALTIFFRIRDSRTHLKIAYRLGEQTELPGDLRRLLYAVQLQEPSIFFTIHNASRTAVLLTDIYLELSSGHTMPLPHLLNISIPSQGPPGFPWVGCHSLQALATALKEEGYAGTTSFKLVALDGTGRSHKKQVEIPNLFSGLNTT